jgi:geranylgeranyl diphosphate synthase, type I
MPGTAQDRTTANTRSGESLSSRLIDGSTALVEPGLRGTVARLPVPVQRVAGYHFGWCDPDGRPVAGGGGKLVRPRLTLACARAAGSPAPAALSAAIAVELVHNFSLLHDDVMDADETRRHRPTVWKVFGVPMAILAGDALLSLAFEELARDDSLGVGACSLLASTVLDLIRGQAADLAFERRAEVSVDECLAMARNKTAALLGCACQLGAMSGGGSRDTVDRLGQFGENLGLAFQMTDDLLGIWGSPALTGKPVFSDLISRKKSLPVAAALASGTPAGRELAVLYARPQPLNAAELRHAADLIEHAGGRSWTQQHAKEATGLALSALFAADLPADAEADLAGLAESMTRRDR